jgi:hypothetical protein
LTIIESDECIEKLQKAYNITADLIIAKTEEKNGTTAKINIEYYNPVSRELLDKSYCTEQVISIKVPIVLTTSEQQRYNRLKKDGIDSFNPNDEAFNSNCLSYIDSETGYDTTLGYRMRSYFTNRPECLANNCEYKGMEKDNSYINCECRGGWKVSEGFSNNILTCSTKIKVSIS